MSKKPTRPILVRGQEVDDWEDVAAMLEMPRVVRYTLQHPYKSRDAIRDRIENPPPNTHTLVAEVDGEVIGLLGLHLGEGRQAHSASLGMMVHDTHQGGGVGTALMNAAIDLAENWLAITRLDLTVFTDNEPALGLYRKFSFEIEGTLREYAFCDGRYVDAYLMARLREEP